MSGSLIARLLATAAAWSSPCFGSTRLSLEPTDLAPVTQPAGSTTFDPFEKGRSSLEVSAAYAHPTINGPQEFLGGTIAVGYAVAMNLITSGELTLDHVDGDGSDGTAVALTLRTRYRFLERDKLSLFVDGAIGVVQSSVDVPEVGTHTNFRSSIGLGALVPLKDDLHLISGARWLHISNAGLDDDNDGYSGVQFYVGIVLPL